MTSGGGTTVSPHSAVKWRLQRRRASSARRPSRVPRVSFGSRARGGRDDLARSSTRGRSRLETVPLARSPAAVRVPVRLRRRDDRRVSPGAARGRARGPRRYRGVVAADGDWHDADGRSAAPGRMLAGHPLRDARPATDSRTDPRRDRVAGAWHRSQHRDLQFSERPGHSVRSLQRRSHQRSLASTPDPTDGCFPGG